MILKTAISNLTAAGAFPPGLDSEGKRVMLNEALERFIISGKWLGTQVVINISVNSSGELTLPRQFMTVRGVQVDGIVRPLAGIWYQFLEHSSDATQFSTDFQDQGWGWATFANPTEPARLRITCANGAGTARVQGNDPDGAHIFNQDGSPGIALEINGPVSTQYVASVSSIDMPETDAIKILYAHYDNNTEIAIGLYEPGETRPTYRRYLVPDARLKDPDALEDTNILAYCQRQFVEAVSDYDVLFTDNIGAMKNGVAAIHYENEGDDTRSQARFDKGIWLLNKQTLRSKADSEIGTIRINTIGGFGGEWLRSTR